MKKEQNLMKRAFCCVKQFILYFSCFFQAGDKLLWFLVQEKGFEVVKKFMGFSIKMENFLGFFFKFCFLLS